MAGDLVEQFRNAAKKAKHKTNGLTLVCLDDESLDRDQYGAMGNRTIVPVSNDEGGIVNRPRGNDCKYGDGVTRRHIGDDGHGGFIVESVEENFRPDKALEPDLFTLAEQEMEPTELEEPEVDQLEVLRKQAQEALAGHIEQRTAPGASTGPAAGTGSEAVMMQMMNTVMQLVAQQQKPAKAPESAAKEAKQPKGTNVTFSGDFGSITVQYSDVKIAGAFIVLVQQHNQPTTYTPPITTKSPLSVQVGASTYAVMNLDLRFEHKGDILLLMPLALNQEDADATETE